MPIPEKIIFAGENASRQGLRWVGNRIGNYITLTRLAPALRAALVEIT